MVFLAFHNSKTFASKNGSLVMGRMTITLDFLIYTILIVSSILRALALGNVNVISKGNLAV